jgi:hypothetical protein
MKKVLVLVVGICVLGLAGCGGQNSKEETMGVKISKEGVNVNLPSVNISTNEDGTTTVTAPGVNITADEEGNASVSAPGVNITADEKGNAKVTAPGVKVETTEDGGSSVDVKKE